MALQARGPTPQEARRSSPSSAPSTRGPPLGPSPPYLPPLRRLRVTLTIARTALSDPPSLGSHQCRGRFRSPGCRAHTPTSSTPTSPREHRIHPLAVAVLKG